MTKSRREPGTVPISSAASEDSPIAVLLKANTAEGKASSFRLTGGSCSVGSGSECDLVIVDRTVSRKHAELTLTPEGIQVIDLGSKNGTFYLEQRVEKIVLGVGATVRLGKAKVVLDVDPSLYEPRWEYPDDEYRAVVGASAAMKKLFALLVRLENATAPILLEGESGTGKELIARAIHAGSRVATGPWVPVNCGAIPRDLVASELFGHKRGAFTGAKETRAGAFESAEGGTLFLDEIGELPLDVQPMLLRALEAREIRPLGSDRVRTVSARVVAATNRDLLAAVAAGRFREDLYYRLAVIRLRVPSLGERMDDIMPLVERFARESGAEPIPPRVVEHMKTRSWPGNVRELKNAVQSYVVLGALPQVESAGLAALDRELSAQVDVERAYAAQKDEIVERFTRAYLVALLAHTQGNQTSAARLAGLDRGYLGKLVSKYVKER